METPQLCQAGSQDSVWLPETALCCKHPWTHTRDVVCWGSRVSPAAIASGRCPAAAAVTLALCPAERDATGRKNEPPRRPFS